MQLLGSKHHEAGPEGVIPLMFAASGPFPETVEFLVKNGANLNVQDFSEEWTALMYAIAEGNYKVVEILQKNRANPSFEDKDGDKSIDFTLVNVQTNVVTILEQ